MPNHIQIIKWAAGAPIVLPDKIDFDTNTLINLTDAHNLSGQFLLRIRESDAKWATPDLVDGLNQLFFETTNQVTRNILAFCELRRQLKSGNTHIILIKGISTYILSDLREIMHAGDIDLLSDNPNDVVQALLNIGYKQTRAPFMHEIGEYTRDTTEFDIHGYFPIYRYSKALLGTDMFPLHHSEGWKQSYLFQHSEITFDDMYKFKNCDRRPETELITVPDASMLAVIISAHAFMNYTNIWSISHREKACVRLGEIIDLFTLSTHHSFSVDRFLGYVNRYQAHDAVEWAASMAVSVFGRNPLPVPAFAGIDQPLSASRFPRCLWWNFWASLLSETDELLQTKWLSMDWLIERIGANHISVQEEPTKSYSTIKTGISLPLMRYITQQMEPIPLVLQVSKYESGVLVRLQVHSSFQFDIERVRVDLGNIACEWIHVSNGNSQEIVGFPMDLSCEHNDWGYEIKLKLDWKDIVIAKKYAALLIGVSRQSSLEVLESTLIPLVLEF